MFKLIPTNLVMFNKTRALFLCHPYLYPLLLLVVLHSMLFNGLHLTLALIFIPHVAATPKVGSFPSIAFKDFSDFVLRNFGPTISLTTVITLLLSMTNNTDLVSLHFKQAEKGSTAWMKCLARAIKERLGPDSTQTLFSDFELSVFSTTITRDSDDISLANKLSEFSQILELYPYNKRKKFTGTLNHISHDSIQPALLICPKSSVCLTSGCNQPSLKQNTQSRDIPWVTLVKGTNVYHNVQLLSGCCAVLYTAPLVLSEFAGLWQKKNSARFCLNWPDFAGVWGSLPDSGGICQTPPN